MPGIYLLAILLFVLGTGISLGMFIHAVMEGRETGDGAAKTSAADDDRRKAHV